MVEETSQGNTRQSIGQKGQYEDFFTSFLAKRKKALAKKIDKIIGLKASAVSLNQEQRDMVKREEEIKRQMQNFDSIRQLYMDAMS